MVKSVTPKKIRESEQYAKVYNKFRGVDFSTDATQVSDSRSPLCQNLISDLAGFPEKRLGWRTLFTVEKINGLFYGAFTHGVFLAHAGTKLYTWTDEGATLIYSSMNDGKSSAFGHGGKMYILDGANYLVVTETVSEDVVPVITYTCTKVVDGDCFIPTTVISAPYSGGGTPFEAVNLLTPKRKNSMIGDGSNTVFQLDSTNIDSVDSVKIEGVAVDVADYTVDLTAGTVTFTTAPAVSSAGSGVDNIEIAFSKAVEGYVDRIGKCTICASYGYNNDNRFFVSGNPDAPNVDWMSGLDDPTYFPDTGYANIGSDTSAIMGYLKQYDSLTIVKSDNNQDAEIYLRTAEMTDDGKLLFPVKQGVKGVGAISKHAFGTLRDDPLFLAREGVFSVASTSVAQERVIQDRGFYVASRLTKEANLQDAVAVVWNGYYILCVNGRCYVADSRQQTGKSQTEQYGYEWYYWTNIPARVFLEHDGALYFGTTDGKVCKFNTDVSTMAKYNDDGEPIEAIWSTKMDDLGDFIHRKSLLKKGCGVMIKPYTRSSVEIYVATDKDLERLIRTGTMDILDFSDIDFSRITFNTNENPQVIPFNTKVKKFIILQIIFKNCTKDEGFGIYGTRIQYARAGYVK